MLYSISRILVYGWTDRMVEGACRPTHDPKVKKKREEASEIAKKEAVTDNKVEEVKKSGKETFTCEECEKVGNSFSSGILNLYENHINMKHPNYKPFKCNICSYSTHKRGNLHKHNKTTHSKVKK